MARSDANVLVRRWYSWQAVATYFVNIAMEVAMQKRAPILAGQRFGKLSVVGVGDPYVNPNTHGAWQLTLDGKPVITGNAYADFRGDTAIITGGKPPHKPGSTGFVHTAAGRELYAHMYDMKWVQLEETNQ